MLYDLSLFAHRLGQNKVKVCVNKLAILEN